MPQLIIAALILWALVYGTRWFAKANPAVVARAVKSGGGLLALVVGGFLLLRGQVELGIGLGALAAWLLGWSAMPNWRAFLMRVSPMAGLMFGADAQGRVSRLRSAMIEVQIDHVSGAMDGLVLAGPDEGRTLNAMTPAQCETLLKACRRDDPEGARHLEAYLDRRFSGWRQAGNGDANAGYGPVARPGAMTQDEAYETLGLQKGASREEITSAHRSLMKKLHPDYGGPTNLAARVNQAKDVLMRRHDN